MTDDLPSIAQIDRAGTSLSIAAETGIAIVHAAPYAPLQRVDTLRRLYVKHLQDAARALGLELVRRDGPRVVVDNTAEPNTMREVK